MIAATEKNKIILGSQIILIYVNKKTHQNTLLPYQPTFMNKRNEKKQFKSQYCSHDMCYDSNHIFIAHKKRQQPANMNTRSYSNFLLRF